MLGFIIVGAVVGLVSSLAFIAIFLLAIRIGKLPVEADVAKLVNKIFFFWPSEKLAKQVEDAKRGINS